MTKSDAGNTGPTTPRATPTTPAPETPPPTTPAAPDGSGRLTVVEAATAGMSGIALLTGKQPEGVTAVEPMSNGWIIAVEVIEDRHVPSTADLLATYEAELGADGTLLAYKRTNRYARGRGDSGRLRS